MKQGRCGIGGSHYVRKIDRWTDEGVLEHLSSECA